MALYFKKLRVLHNSTIVVSAPRITRHKFPFVQILNQRKSMLSNSGFVKNRCYGGCYWFLISAYNNLASQSRSNSDFHSATPWMADGGKVFYLDSDLLARCGSFGHTETSDQCLPQCHNFVYSFPACWFNRWHITALTVREFQTQGILVWTTSQFLLLTFGDA